MDDERHLIILKLINFDASIRELKDLLRSFVWDYEGSCAELNCEHICKVIRRYLNSDLTKHDIEEWANLIEAREDITFELSKKSLLQNVIHELANPKLSTELSIKKGEEIIDLLCWADAEFIAKVESRVRKTGMAIWSYQAKKLWWR